MIKDKMESGKTFEGFLNERENIAGAIRMLRKQQSGEGRIQTARIESTIVELQRESAEIDTCLELLKL